MTERSVDYGKPVKPETPRVAEVVQVVHTRSTRGDGVADILREVDQYWAFDGTLLAEKDPAPPPSGFVTLPGDYTPQMVTDWQREWSRRTTPTRHQELRATYKGVGAVAEWDDVSGLSLHVGDQTKKWPPIQ